MKKLSSVVISLAMVLVGTGCNQQKNLAVVSGQQDGHDYVDLGLPSGTQWATLNVGANQPEENGSYFAWGETAPKHTYEWSNYKYGNGGTDSKIKVNKYNTNKHEGEVDDRLLLESADDAATANWGSKWKTPTKEQWEELINGCEWEWVKNDKGAGVDMKMGKSKANGNTILIPFSGYYNGEAYIKAEGSFWTSTLYTKNGLQAYFARVLTHNINCNNGNKKQGMPIRAVTTK